MELSPYLLVHVLASDIATTCKAATIATDWLAAAEEAAKQLCGTMQLRRTDPDRQTWLQVLRHCRSATIRPQATILGDHTRSVQAMAVSADGRIVSADCHQGVRVWSVEGQALCVIPAKYVLAVATSDHGVVSGGVLDLRIWTWQGEHRATMRKHNGAVRAIAVHTDGRIVSGSEDKTLMVWSAEGEHQATMKGHTAGVSSVAIRPSDGLVVSGSDDHTLMLWSMQEGRRQATLKGHRDRVLSVATATRSFIVISGSEDRTLRVWSSCLSHTFMIISCTCAVSAVAVHPDGRFVAGCIDGTLRAWSEQGHELQTFLPGHTIGITALGIMPDGRVVSASHDNTMRIWE